MSHPLDGCRAKLKRADQHLDELKRRSDTFLSRDAYTTDTDFDRMSGKGIVRVGDITDPPLDFGVIVGDIVHNLRSALDHLMWQLILRDGGTPRSETQFPIFKDGTKYAEPRHAPRMFVGLSPAHVADVASLQPYQRGHAAESDPLWMLYELSNTDKHRVVLVVFYGLLSSGVGYGILGWDASFKIYPQRELKKGAVIVEGTFFHPDPKAKFEVGANIRLEIRFGKGIIAIEDKPVIETLIMIRDAVHNDVFKKFEPAFP